MAYFEHTKTGRLKKPPKVKTYHELDTMPKVGDFVQQMPPVGAGTIGRVVALEASHPYGREATQFDCYIVVEFLDGHTDSAWAHNTWPLTYEAVQEVKEFYIQDGRPERIKVRW